jgi:lipopolysaccharide/colanic/teichoic acid biosynthesis glycosyltransferase
MADNSLTITGTREIGLILKEKNKGFKVKNYLFWKRFCDLALAFLLVILLSWLLIIIAICVKCSSKGPAIYKHKRLGQYGKVINVYKFRTMKTDHLILEEVLTEAQLKQYQTEFKIVDDPRTTKFGKLLRKTSLDELPQIFNIIKGEMSFVGPRPVVDKEIELYYQRTSKIFLQVRPGLTGYWQAYARNDATYSSGERQQMELFYCSNRSFWFDIKIFFKTFSRVLSRKGAE